MLAVQRVVCEPTVTVTDRDVLPPLPTQVIEYVRLEVSAPVEVEPEVGLDPLQLPKAVQLVALAEDQLRLALVL